MLSALEDAQLKGQAVLDHLSGDHHRVDGGNKFVVPVVPDEQGRHVRAGVMDEVQLRGAVLGDFRRIGVVELRVFLDGVGVVPGGIGDDPRVGLDVLRGKTQALRQAWEGKIWQSSAPVSFWMTWATR